jgi:Domain of unknown function (DUF4337)
MALIDSVIAMVTKKAKDPTAPKPPVGSRSEREAKIKDKAGLVINIFALLLAINTYFGNSYSSLILNNTIKANDTWSFYQAKALKQTMAEYSMDDAVRAGDQKRADELKARIERYENEPAEGKKDLMAHAKMLEAVRDEAKKKSPWTSYASTAFQLSIVLLSASILAVSMSLFWGSFIVAAIGTILMTQGIWLWF